MQRDLGPMPRRPRVLITGAGEPRVRDLCAALRRRSIDAILVEGAIEEAIRAERPNVVLLVGDAASDDGARAIDDARRAGSTPIVVATDPEPLDRRLAPFALGASGIVVRRDDPDEMAGELQHLLAENARRIAESVDERAPEELDGLLGLGARELLSRPTPIEGVPRHVEVTPPGVPSWQIDDAPTLEIRGVPTRNPAASALPEWDDLTTKRQPAPEVARWRRLSATDRGALPTPPTRVALDETGAPRAGRAGDDRPGGARADGARADGARADGARADGARADGARADGAPPQPSARKLTPFGASLPRALEARPPSVPPEPRLARASAPPPARPSPVPAAEASAAPPPLVREPGPAFVSPASPASPTPPETASAPVRAGATSTTGERISASALVALGPSSRPPIEDRASTLRAQALPRPRASAAPAMIGLGIVVLGLAAILGPRVIDVARRALDRAREPGPIVAATASSPPAGAERAPSAAPVDPPVDVVPGAPSATPTSSPAIAEPIAPAPALAIAAPTAIAPSPAIAEPMAHAPSPAIAEPIAPVSVAPAASVDDLLRDARALARRGDREGARALLEQAVALDPDDPHATIALASLHLDEGRADDAVRFAQRAVTLRRRRPEYHVVLGDAYRLAGDGAHARASWEAALALDPDRADARERLGP